MTTCDAITRHGFTGKAVRAICAANGWKWGQNGAPAEWYAAWRSGLGAEVERIARTS